MRCHDGLNHRPTASCHLLGARPGTSIAAVAIRILTVEDDERIRTAVKLALEDEGWEVVEAANGEDAIDHLRQSLPMWC
jgi:PleD family two-component response regulator